MENLKMMIHTRTGYVNASSIENVFGDREGKNGGWETSIGLKGSETVDYVLGEQEDVLLACATVIPAHPGFNVALAWEDNGEWFSSNHPVVGWAIQDRQEPEPIAAGMPSNIGNERPLIFPDGQAHTEHQTFENIAAWLSPLKERSRKARASVLASV
jgi:hypothetical protein